MNAPLPLWKIVLLWLGVGIACVIWTMDDEPAPAAPIIATRDA
ncbi:hypothetical protein AB4851_20665 [Burkholderia sp. 22PA0099]